MSKWTKGEFQTSIEDADGNEHEVTVKFNGYYDPGRLYGPPENCYPPEGEMEIELSPPLPENVNFGDLDAIEERLIDEAWVQYRSWRK